MTPLQKKINTIPKIVFTFADIRKIAEMSDASLRVSLNRMVRSGSIVRILKGVYTTDCARVDWEKFAQALYSPSALSFEYVLGREHILSQKPYALTLVTTKRARTIKAPRATIVFRHIRPSLYWGYVRKNSTYIAEPEKAFLDLAYLSLNGYATFDSEEMNLSLLNLKKVSQYLK
ncbi:hypothetical protein HY620_00435, partial [Candidatus Uhrbacteria bacterium]|nr:hypothetical protein [Candidatus Uhrbacteria bacterium]